MGNTLARDNIEEYNTLSQVYTKKMITAVSQIGVDGKEICKLLQENNAYIAGPFALQVYMDIKDGNWENDYLDIWCNSDSSASDIVSALARWGYQRPRDDYQKGIEQSRAQYAQYLREKNKSRGQSNYGKKKNQSRSQKFSLFRKEKDDSECRRSIDKAERIIKMVKGGYRNIRIIFTKEPIAVVAANFDISVCRVGFDGKNLLITEATKDDIKEKIIRFTISQDLNGWIYTGSLISKYIGRGFTVDEYSLVGCLQLSTRLYTADDVEFIDFMQTWNNVCSFRIDNGEIEIKSSYQIVFENDNLSFLRYQKNECNRLRNEILFNPYKELAGFPGNRYVSLFDKLQNILDFESDYSEVITEREKYVTEITAGWNNQVNIYQNENKFLYLPIFYHDGYVLKMFEEGSNFALWSSDYEPEHPALVPEKYFDVLDLRESIDIQTCTDLVLFEEHKTLNYMRANNLAAIITANRMFCIPIGRIRQIFDYTITEEWNWNANSDIFYECKENTEGKITRFSPNTTKAYVLIRLDANFLVPLVHVRNMISQFNGGKTRYFKITPSGIKFERTSSLGPAVNMDARLTEAGVAPQNFINTDHCQAGSNKLIYNLLPILPLV
jgi:hypothetical protein